MRNAYILFISQALVTSLLFFSEGYMKYATIGLFLLIDLILFVDVLVCKQSSESLLTFASILCSGAFLLFFLFSRSAFTMLFWIALILLFVVMAVVTLIGRGAPRTNISGKISGKISAPKYPSYDEPQYYDVEYDHGTVYDAEPDATRRTESRPEPVMHITPKVDKDVTKNRLAAKAVAAELEKEARQLKDAEQMIQNLETYNAEKELMKESRELEAAQKQIDSAKNAMKVAKAAKELKKEARELKKVQKEIDNIKKLKEIETEAKAMKKAEKQIKELNFLNQQEKIVKQAKDIAKAQKEIDEMTKNTKKSVVRQASAAKAVTKAASRPKAQSPKDESFYFATENGDKFHEPGCLALKKVPKNKLTLYTSKKDAMKKGLKPCNVCIPK